MNWKHDAPETLPHHQKPHIAPHRAPSVTILIVDDNDDLRELLQRALQRHGFSVHPAADGAEALRWSEQHEGTIQILVSATGFVRLQKWIYSRTRHSNASSRVLKVEVSRWEKMGTFYVGARNVLRAQPSRFLHERAIERDHFLDLDQHFMVDFCAFIIG